jgi:hypothetical protein
MNPRSTLFVFLLGVAAWGCGFRSGRGFNNDNNNGPLPGVDAGCNPNGPDSCAAAGLACTPILPSTNFSCQLPGPFFACEPNVGCATGLDCVDGVCLQACTATATCGDPLTLCAVLENGNPDAGTGQDAGTFCLLSSCGSPDGGGFWQPCNDGGGTCVVLFSNAFSGPQGACLQGGSVAAGGTCAYYRGDGGLCAPGLICTVDAAGNNAGICLPVCDPFADGGPECESGMACVESSIPAAPPAISFFDYDNHSGVCAQSCVPDGGSADPADAGEPADAGAADAGSADAGSVDGGAVDGGAPDAGATADAGSGTVDAGPPATAACSAPTSCTNASTTTTPTFVCLP